ncbi:MobA/MobL family protein [Candidatus Igneacidithiobacillus taiwanensis]|uniref:MobA/MobL family protein n=1 Tax=Candidatus Igneacidithiobacillus taiwanensis TaxID=1945924 RepID=UPI00289A06EE|nr:MobA/MobL family protein [Candidatus Igneacidithiobacillus taiwanensis]
MAVYHLHVHSGNKASGKGAGGKARYVLREGPYATARERVVEGSLVREVEIDKAAELVYAESGNIPAWAADNPVLFWDASDQYERANGCTYREVEVALPEELSLKDQIALASAFARELAQVAEGATPYTLAIHQQDPAHPNRRHVHILVSDRVFDGQDRLPATFFKRYNSKEPGKGGARKTGERSFQKGGDKAVWTDRIRPLWQDLVNRALERAGLAVRIDHRTLEEQRREVERQAAQEQDPQKRRVLEERAAALDRPPQPKRGRVLTHAGPEKAPDRAALVIAYEQAKAERQATLEARRAAEREAELVAEELAKAQRILTIRRMLEARREALEIARRERILTAQQQRHERRNAQAIQGRWNIRRNDRATAAEQRPGIRYPEREQWVAWRRKRLTEEYGKDLAEKLAPWVRVQRDKGNHLVLTNREIDIVDRGDRVVARKGGTDREIQVLLEVAKAKGWSTLSLTGPAEFQAKIARAALSQGFALADKDLEARTRAAMEREAAERVRQEAERKAAEEAIRIDAERQAREAEAKRQAEERVRQEAEIAAEPLPVFDMPDFDAVKDDPAIKELEKLLQETRAEWGRPKKPAKAKDKPIPSPAKPIEPVRDTSSPAPQPTLQKDQPTPPKEDHPLPAPLPPSQGVPKVEKPVPQQQRDTRPEMPSQQVEKAQPPIPSQQRETAPRPAQDQRPEPRPAQRTREQVEADLAALGYRLGYAGLTLAPENMTDEQKDSFGRLVREGRPLGIEKAREYVYQGWKEGQQKSLDEWLSRLPRYDDSRARGLVVGTYLGKAAEGHLCVVRNWKRGGVEECCIVPSGMSRKLDNAPYIPVGAYVSTSGPEKLPHLTKLEESKLSKIIEGLPPAVRSSIQAQADKDREQRLAIGRGIRGLQR